MNRVLCYDVSQDRRRNRLHKQLKRFLLPVQKSVFQGPLPPHLLQQMLAMVEREIDPATDSTRLYSLCQTCSERLVIIGTAKPITDFDEPIIID